LSLTATLTVFPKLSMGEAYCLPEGRTELLRQPRVAELPGSTSDKADPGLPGGRSPLGVKVIKELPGFSDDGFAKGGGAYHRPQQSGKSGDAFRPSAKTREPEGTPVGLPATLLTSRLRPAEVVRARPEDVHLRIR
jgi:hypothetical protein